MNAIYSGDVYITTKHHKYHLKNAGTDVLFKLMASVLTGGTISRNSLPTYIQLRKGKADTLTLGVNPIKDNCLLYNPILVSKHMELKTTRTSAKWTTVITGILVPDNISGKLENNTDEGYHFVIMDNDRYPLAAVDLNKINIAELQNGEETLIQWNLSFSNGEKT